MSLLNWPITLLVLCLGFDKDGIVKVRIDLQVP